MLAAEEWLVKFQIPPNGISHINPYFHKYKKISLKEKKIKMAQ